MDTPSTPGSETPKAPVTIAQKRELTTAADKARIARYTYNERLFLGEHSDAFRVKISSPNYTADYAKLRYVMCNFAGLVSKVMADMIFSEAPKIWVKDGDQDYLDALMRENRFKSLNYEQALANSYFGDILYKVRVDERYSGQGSTVIIDQVQPLIYFPKLDPYNVTAPPKEQILGWKLKIGEREYVRMEIHTPGMIRNELWMLDDEGYMTAQASIGLLGIDGLQEEVLTGIDRSLVVHVPNWKAGARHFGFSDYYDLDNLFFAINNRMTKIDNILDHHSDPILALPPGILDEEGKVRKEALGMIERPKGATKEDDPAYITWDANLEAAFKEIDKLVEMLFMISETSPDILGMGKGVSDSGRALKLKILRTVAKAQRKILYFDQGIKEVLYVAQLMAKEHGLDADGVKISKDPVVPEIKWMDGIPKDDGEQTDIEVKRIDAGLTTKKAAIMRIDGVDEDIAEQEVKDIEEESKIDLPNMNTSFDAGKFNKNGDTTNAGKETQNPPVVPPAK